MEIPLLVITIGDELQSGQTESSSSGEGSGDDDGYESNLLSRPYEKEVTGGGFTVKIESSKGAVRWFEVIKRAFSIGSSPHNDVFIQGDDLGVERSHARVEYRAERLWLTDLRSKTGTWVDGKELETDKPVAIANQSKVRLGNVQLKITLEIKEVVCKERRDRGEGQEFTDNLEKSVFRRKKQEIGQIKDLAKEQRKKRKRGIRRRRDEFGRSREEYGSDSDSSSDVGKSSSRKKYSRSRSRSRSGERDGSREGKSSRQNKKHHQRERRSRSRSWERKKGSESRKGGERERHQNYHSDRDFEKGGGGEADNRYADKDRVAARNKLQQGRGNARDRWEQMSGAGRADQRGAQLDWKKAKMHTASPSPSRSRSRSRSRSLDARVWGGTNKSARFGGGGGHMTGGGLRGRERSRSRSRSCQRWVFTGKQPGPRQGGEEVVTTGGRRRSLSKSPPTLSQFGRDRDKTPPFAR